MRNEWGHGAPRQVLTRLGLRANKADFEAIASGVPGAIEAFLSQLRLKLLNAQKKRLDSGRPAAVRPVSSHMHVGA